MHRGQAGPGPRLLLHAGLRLRSMAAGAHRQAGTEPTAVRRRQQAVARAEALRLWSWGDGGRLGAFGIFLRRTVVRGSRPLGNCNSTFGTAVGDPMARPGLIGRFKFTKG